MQSMENCCDRSPSTPTGGKYCGTHFADKDCPRAMPFIRTWAPEAHLCCNGLPEVRLSVRLARGTQPPTRERPADVCRVRTCVADNAYSSAAVTVWAPTRRASRCARRSDPCRCRRITLTKGVGTIVTGSVDWDWVPP